jgi:transposase-like protein
MEMTVSSGKSPAREVEVAAKSRRRSFTAEYKRKVLAEADAITQRGELGALLRREGLYSSHLVEWRRLAKSGALGGLGAKKRGPKAKKRDERDEQIAKLERELAREIKRREHAEIIIEVQKKVSQLLGVDVPPTEKL